MCRYFHDSQNAIVYKIDKHVIDENKNRKGKRRWWYIWTSIHITSKVNVLNGSQWKQKILDTKDEYFDKKYTREDVINYFMSNIYPKSCLEISSEEYNFFQRHYEKEAKNNSI